MYRRDCGVTETLEIALADMSDRVTAWWQLESIESTASGSFFWPKARGSINCIRTYYRAYVRARTLCTTNLVYTEGNKR